MIFGWDIGDVSYDAGQFTGWHTGYPDAVANLDLQTFRKVPWDNDVCFFLGDFNSDICPRTLLRRAKFEAEKMGFEASFGQEFEWFNFKETSQGMLDKNYTHPTHLTPGMFGFSILRMSQNREFLKRQSSMVMCLNPLTGR